MPAFKFTYTTPIMPCECVVIKFGRTPEQAIAFFASGSIKQKNLRIIKAGAAMTLTKEPEELC